MIPQFTITYLLLEVFWVAATLGLFIQAQQNEGLSFPLLCAAYLSGSAACGGIFHEMKVGVYFGVVIAALGFVASIFFGHLV
jgi:hypothetical protein